MSQKSISLFSNTPVVDHAGARPTETIGLAMAVDRLIDAEPATPSGSLIGYGAISTRGQLLDGQLDALTAAGCKRMFTDTISGATLEHPELAAVATHLAFAASRPTMVGPISTAVIGPTAYATPLTWPATRPGGHHFVTILSGRGG